MQEIKRCTRCILPQSLPNITFDHMGVCNYCRNYEANFKNWDEVKEKKEHEFLMILKKAQGLKRPYDVLIPLSGGKDSTYALYLCTKVYHLKTLAVTFDNGFLSNLAKDNIYNSILSTNSDHVFYTLNKKNSIKLYKHFTHKTGDFCNACMRGINYSIEFAARNFKVPLIIKGSGRRVQYVSQIKEISSLNTASYFLNVMKKTSIKNEFNYFAGQKYNLEIQKIFGGICDIMGIKRTILMKLIPQHIGLYDYIYHPYPEIIDTIKTEMKWNSFPESTEHLDCSLHDIPFYKDTLRIPNITKYTFYNSGLIRQGLLTRESALLNENNEMIRNAPPSELYTFLSAINMTYEQYKDAVIEADKSKFEPKIQKKAREIYHRFRKY